MVVFHRFLEHCVLLAGTCLSDKVTAALSAESTTSRYKVRYVDLRNECSDAFKGKNERLADTKSRIGSRRKRKTNRWNISDVPVMD